MTATKTHPVLNRVERRRFAKGKAAKGFWAVGGRTNAAIKGSIGQVGGNLIKNISQPVGDTTANISYTYDNDGRVINRVIDGAQESYGFNGVGQLTNVGNPLGNFGYSYDPASARLIQVTYPNGQQTNMDYFTASATNGASGSLKDLTNLGGGTTSGQTLSKFSYTYNPTGEINTWNQQLDNNPSDAKTYGMGYDQDSELQGVTLTSGTSGFDGLTANQSVSYGYDASGNRTVEQAPKFTHTFGTNNLNQLINETANPISVLGFTNRPASVLVNATPVPENTSNQFQTNILPQGNQTPMTILAVAPDGTTTSKKNHVLSTTPFTYDANGNLIKDQNYTYSWDAENRLVSLNFINPQPVNMADNITFIYDGRGRRVGIVESHGSTVLTSKTFVWCESRLCEERDSTGHTVTKQFYGYGELIGNFSYYFANDQLGSIRELTDINGNIQASYDYNPWGRQMVLSQAVTADFGYTGFYVNKTTGLDLTWYRIYDPEKGRWLSRDPLGEFVKLNLNRQTGPNLYAYVESVGKPSMNLYEYASNNPINFIDPSGLLAFGSSIGVEGLAAYGAAGVGGTASAGGGYFWGPGLQYNGSGDYATAGYFAGTPTSIGQSGGGFGLGAAASAGGGFWVSNANSIYDLNGPFNLFNIYLPFTTISFSTGTGSQGQSIWQAGFSFGPFGGVGISDYTTTTEGSMNSVSSGCPHAP